MPNAEELRELAARTYSLAIDRPFPPKHASTLTKLGCLRPASIKPMSVPALSCSTKEIRGG
jgi:hypothetical protein